MSQETQTRTVTLAELKKYAMHNFKKQRPMFVWGPPGIGKSETFEQIKQDYIDRGQTCHLIDARLALWDPTDLKGEAPAGGILDRSHGAKPIPQHRRQLATEGAEQHLRPVELRVVTAAVIEVFADHDIARKRVVPLVVEALGVSDDHDRSGRISRKDVVLDKDLVIGHDQDAGAPAHARDDIAGRGEIGRVVRDHEIVGHDHIAAAHDR